MATEKNTIETHYKATGFDELNKEAKKSAKAMGEVSDSGDGLAELNEALDDTAKKSGVLTKHSTRLAAASTSSGKQFSSEAQGLGGLVAAYAGAAATVFALTAAYSALSNAGKNLQTLTGLESIAANVAEDGMVILGNVREITKYQLSLANAAQQINLGLSAGFSSEQIEGLAEVALKASRALGRDLTDAYTRVTRASSKLETELLDELGIYTKIDPATRAYAIVLGKSASELTEFERRQAFVNGVIDEGKRKFDSINTTIPTASEKIEAFGTKIVDLGTKIGNVLVQPIADFATIITENIGAAVGALGWALSLALGKTSEVLEMALGKWTASLHNLAIRLDKTSFFFDKDALNSAREAAGTIDKQTFGLTKKNRAELNELKKINEERGLTNVELNRTKQLLTERFARLTEIRRGHIKDVLNLRKEKELVKTITKDRKEQYQLHKKLNEQIQTSGIRIHKNNELMTDTIRQIQTITAITGTKLGRIRLIASQIGAGLLSGVQAAGDLGVGLVRVAGKAIMLSSILGIGASVIASMVGKSDELNATLKNTGEVVKNFFQGTDRRKLGETLLGLTDGAIKDLEKINEKLREIDKFKFRSDLIDLPFIGGIFNVQVEKTKQDLARDVNKAILQVSDIEKTFGESMASKAAVIGGLIGTVLGGAAGFFAGPLGIPVGLKTGGALGAAAGGLTGSALDYSASAQESPINPIALEKVQSRHRLDKDVSKEAIRSSAKAITYLRERYVEEARINSEARLYLETMEEILIKQAKFHDNLKQIKELQDATGQSADKIAQKYEFMVQSAFTSIADTNLRGKELLFGLTDFSDIDKLFDEKHTVGGPWKWLFDNSDQYKQRMIDVSTAVGKVDDSLLKAVAVGHQMEDALLNGTAASEKFGQQIEAMSNAITRAERDSIQTKVTLDKLFNELPFGVNSADIIQLRDEEVGNVKNQAKNIEILKEALADLREEAKAIEISELIGAFTRGIAPRAPNYFKDALDVFKELKKEGASTIEVLNGMNSTYAKLGSAFVAYSTGVKNTIKDSGLKLTTDEIATILKITQDNAKDNLSVLNSIKNTQIDLVDGNKTLIITQKSINNETGELGNKVAKINLTTNEINKAGQNYNTLLDSIGQQASALGKELLKTLLTHDKIVENVSKEVEKTKELLSLTEVKNKNELNATVRKAEIANAKLTTSLLKEDLSILTKTVKEQEKLFKLVMETSKTELDALEKIKDTNKDIYKDKIDSANLDSSLSARSGTLAGVTSSANDFTSIAIELAEFRNLISKEVDLIDIMVDQAKSERQDQLKILNKRKEIANIEIVNAEKQLAKEELIANARVKNLTQAHLVSRMSILAEKAAIDDKKSLVQKEFENKKSQLLREQEISDKKVSKEYNNLITQLDIIKIEDTTRKTFLKNWANLIGEVNKISFIDDLETVDSIRAKLEKNKSEVLAANKEVNRLAIESAKTEHDYKIIGIGIEKDHLANKLEVEDKLSKLRISTVKKESEVAKMQLEQQIEASKKKLLEVTNEITKLTSEKLSDSVAEKIIDTLNKITDNLVSAVKKVAGASVRIDIDVKEVARSINVLLDQVITNSIKRAIIRVNDDINNLNNARSAMQQDGAFANSIIEALKGALDTDIANFDKVLMQRNKEFIVQESKLVLQRHKLEEILIATEHKQQLKTIELDRDIKIAELASRKELLVAELKGRLEIAKTTATNLTKYLDSQKSIFDYFLESLDRLLGIDYFSPKTKEEIGIDNINTASSLLESKITDIESSYDKLIAVNNDYFNKQKVIVEQLTRYKTEDLNKNTKSDIASLFNSFVSEDRAYQQSLLDKISSSLDTKQLEAELISLKNTISSMRLEEVVKILDARLSSIDADKTRLSNDSAFITKMTELDLDISKLTDVMKSTKLLQLASAITNQTKKLIMQQKEVTKERFEAQKRVIEETKRQALEAADLEAKERLAAAEFSKSIVDLDIKSRADLVKEFKTLFDKFLTDQERVNKAFIEALGSDSSSMSVSRSDYFSEVSVSNITEKLEEAFSKFKTASDNINSAAKEIAEQKAMSAIRELENTLASNLSSLDNERRESARELFIQIQETRNSLIEGLKEAFDTKELENQLKSLTDTLATLRLQEAISKLDYRLSTITADKTSLTNNNAFVRRNTELEAALNDLPEVTKSANLLKLTETFTRETNRLIEAEKATTIERAEVQKRLIEETKRQELATIKAESAERLAISDANTEITKADIESRVRLVKELDSVLAWYLDEQVKVNDNLIANLKKTGFLTGDIESTGKSRSSYISDLNLDSVLEDLEIARAKFKETNDQITAISTKIAEETAANGVASVNKELESQMRVLFEEQQENERALFIARKEHELQLAQEGFAQAQLIKDKLLNLFNSLENNLNSMFLSMNDVLVYNRKQEGESSKDAYKRIFGTMLQQTQRDVAEATVYRPVSEGLTNGIFNLFGIKGKKGIQDARVTAEGALLVQQVNGGEGKITNINDAVAGDLTEGRWGRLYNKANNWIGEIFNGIGNSLKNIFGGIISNIGGAGANSMASAIASVFGFSQGGFVPVGITTKFAAGGRVRDRVPAMLEPGEFVMRKHAAKKLGSSNLQAMNATGVTPGMGNVEVNVVNNGTPQEVEATTPPRLDGEKYVIDVVVRDMKNNGRTRQAMRDRL